MSQQSPNNGCVYLVGAGPGDPELATVKSLRLLSEADCVVYDALANEALLEHVRDGAELIDAGKRARDHTMRQDEINALLAERAMAGLNVVRLKGGDPYVFGRGSEEMLYLVSRGVVVEVVPGVTAGLAAPAYAGIPVTHRNIAATVTFVTGHEESGKDSPGVDYQALAGLAAGGGTLCFYMGMGRLDEIVGKLIEAGVDEKTPTAVVQWGTLPAQRSVRAELCGLVEAVKRQGLAAPAVIVVGPVAQAGPDGALCWFETRELFGQTVLITRAREQAGMLRKRLELLGARVLEAPTIELQDPEDWSAVDAAIGTVSNYDWLVLTSANGVGALGARLKALGLDARRLAGVKVAAVGEATARALGGLGIGCDLVSTKFVARSLARELIDNEGVEGCRVLMLRADIARPELPAMLRQAGAEVDDLTVYHTRSARSLPPEVVEAVADGQVDWITLTSASTVRHFTELMGADRAWAKSVRLASIGPVTTEAAVGLGLKIGAEAESHTVDGLLDAMCVAVESGKG